MFPHSLGQENLLRYERHFAGSPSKWDFFAQKISRHCESNKSPPHCQCAIHHIHRDLSREPFHSFTLTLLPLFSLDLPTPGCLRYSPAMYPTNFPSGLHNSTTFSKSSAL